MQVYLTEIKYIFIFATQKQTIFENTQLQRTQKLLKHSTIGN